jgi:hypothetical protein
MEQKIETTDMTALSLSIIVPTYIKMAQANSLS